MLRGVLLDLDGTLIDSNDAHARAWVETFHEAGHRDVTYDRCRRLIGMGGDKLVEAVLGLDPDSRGSHALRDRRQKLFQERHLHGIRRWPSTRAFLAKLELAGLPHILATSASPADLKALLRETGLEELKAGATTAGDAEESKPAPDIVEAAIEAIALPASDLVMIGDTPYDALAAKRAGVRCIGLTCGGWSADELDAAGAVAVFRDPADLVERWQMV